MMKKLLLAFLYIFLFGILNLRAQDIHFSQFYNAPLLLNPANTGFFNCDYRFTANYRSQWKSIPVPFNTFTASADLRLVKGHTGKNILGLGFVSSVDEAGDSKFTTTQFAISAAYHKDLDKNGTQFLGAGLMLGYTSASIDYSGLLFTDQYTGIPGVYNATKDNIALNTLNFFDFSGGLVYNYVPNHDNNFSIGGAVYHINQPVKSFMGVDVQDAFLPRKYVLSGGAEFKLSTHLQLLPKAMFELQGPSTELDLGSLIRVNIDKMDNSKYGIYFGMFYRLNDAIIFVTRFDMGNFSFAFSYDLNVSALTEVTDSRGGPELSLIYIGCFAEKKHNQSLYCPRF